MKTYGLYFTFLALTACLLILAACGDGEIVDFGKGSEEYVIINGVKDNLTAGDGLIAVCKNENLEKCESFYPESSSSSEEEPSEEPSSSSSEDEELLSSSSEGDELSSSSEEPESSSSSIEMIPYEIPEFTCSWNPDIVQSGNNAQVKVKFSEPNETAEADCENTAWLTIPILNDIGLPDGYDTAFFALGENIKTSGIIKAKGGAMKVWPDSGFFDIVNSRVSCENPFAGKSMVSKEQACGPLYIEYVEAPSSSSLEEPSSSSVEVVVPSSSSASVVPSSSSSAPSSSSVAPSSSSVAPSSSSVAPSSSSVAPSSSSVAPSSSSATPSSSSVAPSSSSKPSSSSSITCKTVAITSTEGSNNKVEDVKVDDCITITCDASYTAALQLGTWSGSMTVDIASGTGGCSKQNHTVTKDNFGEACKFTAKMATATVTILTAPSGTPQLNIGCW